MKETKRGISLIVLIITIVVMLILVSIIVMSFSKSNPISKASEVKFKSDVKGFREELLATHASKAYDNLSYKKENVNISLDNYSEMKEYIEDISEKWCKKLYISKGELVYGGTDETEKKWFEDVVNGNFDGSNNGGSSDGSTTTDSNVKTEWKQYIGKVTSDGVPIPKGFDYVTGTKDNGLVIKDGEGNEFVWVPATESTYIKDTSFPGYTPTGDDTLPNGITDETADVVKYGGFYIGRYEAGIPEGDTSPSNKTGIPVSKKGAIVWESIDYTNSKASAESMISNEYVQTGLITGKAWDTTCHWIEDSLSSINASASLKDSRYYGNHSNSLAPANENSGTKRTAGFSENWKTKNIYDLAGNVYEWTSEASSSYFIFRGGSWLNDGSDSPVSYRGNGFASSTDVKVGFRPRLYIK